MQKASPDLMRAWARLLKVQQRLNAAVERDLKQAGALPLDWYDALLELERAPDGRLTPGELWREIIERKNMAVALLAGAVAIGISNIIAAAVHG